jgi:prepilin-type N-terminal cleavage/methylation domain-containing protein
VALRSQQRGFTLLETMIAIVIFSIGAFGVMRLQIEAIRVNRFGGHMTQAMMLADERAQALLARDFDDPVLADSNGGNDPSNDSQPFPISNPNGATPDMAESTGIIEGFSSSGSVVAIGAGEAFQRYYMVADQDLNTSISGNDAKRIRVNVRFRDGESTQWREVGLVVVKVKVQ